MASVRVALLQFMDAFLKHCRFNSSLGLLLLQLLLFSWYCYFKLPPVSCSWNVSTPHFADTLENFANLSYFQFQVYFFSAALCIELCLVFSFLSVVLSCFQKENVHYWVSRSGEQPNAGVFIQRWAELGSESCFEGRQVSPGVCCPQRLLTLMICSLDLLHTSSWEIDSPRLSFLEQRFFFYI